MPRSALAIALFALFALALASTPTPAQPPLGGKNQFDKAPIIPGFGESPLPKDFAKRAEVDLWVTPKKAKWGETVTVKLTIAPKAGAWTYPASPKDTKQRSQNLIELPAPGDVIFIGKVTDPQIEWKLKPRNEKESNGPQDQYFDKAVTWEFKAVVSPKAKAGKATIAIPSSILLACDDARCVSATGKELPTATLEITDAASDQVNRQDLAAAMAILTNYKQERGNGLAVLPPPSTGETEKGVTRKDPKPLEVYAEELQSLAPKIIGAEPPPQTGLWAFVVTAAVWGLISLVTPCVFPMIPITVSIFLKQAHGSFRERLKLAGVYSLTIIAVLGVSAFALLKFMAWLSTQPATNLFLALLFIILALSLFGMYEIALPNVLQKRLQARQAKGGTVGTIFGALAFTVISFTCVAPFLGGFAGISAAGENGGSLIAMPTAKEIAGGLAFATAFAAPFFVLALVPGLLKALPKSGGWLDSVKVVMGFLELAAALKFLRTAELGLLPATQYFTYDVVLGGWVAISAACGLYLLNVFRLPHDEEKPNIGVPRLLFALCFLGFAVYLAPALFKGADGKPQRPAGAVYAWVEAFLLPELPQAGTSKTDAWRTDLKETIEASRKTGRPIFVDFTGVTCQNCGLNERNVFPLPAVQEELQTYERVKFFTDWVPSEFYRSDPGFPARKAEALANRDFQLAVFKDIKLPLYAVLMPLPDGKVKVVGVYDEGKINDPAKFAAFLKEMQEKAKTVK